MYKLINKKMIVAINKMTIALVPGGEDFAGKNNMIHGKSLGFVEGIKSNKRFGKVTYPTKYHIAAAYLVNILQQHIFIDGNKRTALATAITFLHLNGIYFDPFDDKKTFDKIKYFTMSETPPYELISEAADWLEKMSME
mgnify:CR=1 FL=1|tara:strand:- start:4192 stop:4608 length:417 start_codon:yes stop_codon:yes gene_type:complete